MKNIFELQEGLGRVFEGLESGKLKVPVAKEMNNAGGKLIGTCKILLENAAQRKEPPNIAFLREAS